MKRCYFILIITIALFLSSFQDTLNEFEILASNYEAQGKLSEAGDFYNKSGYAYWNRGETNKAAKVFEKALVLFSQQNNLNACITINNNLGLVYSEQEKYKNAAKAFANALSLSRKAKNNTEVLNALINLCNVEIEIQDYQNALSNSKEALALATEKNDLKLIAKCYSLLAEGYEKTGDAGMAFKYYELFSSADKSIKLKEMAEIKSLSAEEVSKAHEGKKVTEIELKIKKGELRLTQDSLIISERIAFERQIENNNINAKLRQKEIQLKYEKRIRIILIIGITLVLLFLIMSVYLLVQKLKDNKLLRKQKEEITNQKNKLDVQNKKITDSIHYGLRIQQAMLPDLSNLEPAFEIFTIYKPKDIVSGDFYWCCETNDNKQLYKYIAVVDCTGHGVPGAFMSMIGNRLLNDIVVFRKKYQPSEILNLLNETLHKELHQDVNHNTDGMDISLCRLAKMDESNYELLYAGAKRPMLIYYNKEKKIEPVEGDTKTIGGVFTNSLNNFTDKKVFVSRGDTLILFSDGIIDQQNKSRARFGTNRFVETLTNNMSKPLNECKVEIESIFSNFKESEEQRDDITIIGLRIK